MIVEIYRQRRALADTGHHPTRVVMSQAHYRLIQDYRATLGDAPEGKVDYMDRYRLFDLEIHIEQVDEPFVE